MKRMSLIDKTFHTYPQAIRPVLDTLLTRKEVRKLMQEVVNQLGKISIEVNEKAAPACWNWKDKKIKVHPTLTQEGKERELISYVIFEMCNAKRTHSFQSLSRLEDVDSFVEAFERLEHASYLDARALDDNPHFGSFQDFEKHYSLQQLAGHSERVAKAYFPDSSYRGTLQTPLEELSPEQKALGKIYLQCLLNRERNFEVGKSEALLEKMRSFVAPLFS